MSNKGFTYDDLKKCWYYYENGEKLTGWQYMDEKRGEKTPHWSYFGKDGVLRTGWQYLDEKDDEKTPHWSYFGKDGWLRTDWQYLDEKEGEKTPHWSFFGKKGWLVKNTLYNDGKNIHYLDDKGWLVTNDFRNVDGNWYYFNSRGWAYRGGFKIMTKNEKQNKMHYSYFRDNGIMVINESIQVNGNTYKFDNKGWLIDSSAPVGIAYYDWTSRFNKYNLKAPNRLSPLYITVHNTANNAPAENEINFMQNNDDSTSFHYAVDETKVILGIPLNRNTWHAGDRDGDGNRKSISVEICRSTSDTSLFLKAEDNGANLIGWLLAKYNFGIDRLKKHQDWSGKYCPHRTLDIGYERFVAKVDFYRMLYINR